jgi:ankyrin repeat protein
VKFATSGALPFIEVTMDMRQHSPIISAALDGDIDKLTNLIATEHDNLNERDYTFGTPLHAAIFKNHLDAVKLLLSAGADVTLLAPWEEFAECDTPLMLAARLGHRDIAMLLWKTFPGQGLSLAAGKYTALENACLNGHAQVTLDLLEWWDGWTDQETSRVLELAASRWNAGCVQALLEKRQFVQEALDAALLKAADMMRNPLIKKYTDAHFENQVQTIRSLCHAGADKNARQHAGADKNGRHYPSQFAIQIAAGNPETSQGLLTLLEEGSDPNTVNSAGQSALAIALVPARKRSFHGSRVRKTSMIKILLEHGASVDTIDRHGQSPLHAVAYHGDVAQFKICLQRSENPQLKDVYGETVLHKAAAGNQHEIVELLLASGMDPNQRTMYGWTPLILAMQSLVQPVKDASQTVQFLLNHNANVNAKSDSGWTALHRIADLSREEAAVVQLASLLLDRGANTEALAKIPSKLPPGKYRSAMAGHLVEELIAQEPQNDVESVVTDQTPLHWAADAGQLGLMTCLLEHGANPSARDSLGATPMIYAIRSEYQTYPPYDTARKQQAVKLILAAGADYTDRDVYGWSVSTWADEHGITSNWEEW